MKKRNFVPVIAIILALLLTACTSAPNVMDSVEDLDVTAPDFGGEDNSAETKNEGMMENDAMIENDSGDIEAGIGVMENDSLITPDWFKASMINVLTGENFTIADFSGKVVLVETLAMWCSNCLKQQNQVKELHGLSEFGDDFISIGIDIDLNEREDALINYVNKNGFDWVYTVAPVEVAHEIGLLYGTQFLNPPSTPMLIIDRHGEVHLLPFGIKSAQDLLNYLEPFLNEPI